MMSPLRRKLLITVPNTRRPISRCTAGTMCSLAVWIFLSGRSDLLAQGRTTLQWSRPQPKSVRVDNLGKVPTEQQSASNASPLVIAQADPASNLQIRDSTTAEPPRGKARAQITLLDSPHSTSNSQRPADTVPAFYAGHRTTTIPGAHLGPPRPSVTVTEDEAGLRWQRAKVPVGQSAVSRENPVHPVAWLSETVDGPELVAPKASTEPDPFNDPFGDRQSANPTSMVDHALSLASDEGVPLELNPPTGDLPTVPDEAPLRLEAVPEYPGVRHLPRGSTGQQSENSDKVDVSLRPDAPGSVSQDQSSQGGQDRASRSYRSTPLAGQRHIYNERDCDQDVANCQRLREQVRARSVRQISLDISPSFNPVTLESGEAPPERPRTFLNEYRAWTDAQGRVVAVGALQGIEHGRLLIKTRDGKIERIAYRDLSDTDQCYFAAWWGVPSECTLGYERYQPRQPVPATFAWKAASVYHKPLYFEEVQLERYGHSARPLVQTALSGAHFVANIASLPYQMAIHPPWECQYPLGHYRPGDPAPWLVPPVPISVKGGLAEAGTILGAVFVIP